MTEMRDRGAVPLRHLPYRLSGSGVDFNIQYRLIGLGDDDVRPFGGGKKRASRDPEESQEEF